MVERDKQIPTMVGRVPRKILDHGRTRQTNSYYRRSDAYSIFNYEVERDKQIPTIVGGFAEKKGIDGRTRQTNSYYRRYCKFEKFTVHLYHIYLLWK